MRAKWTGGMAQAVDRASAFQVWSPEFKLKSHWERGREGGRKREREERGRAKAGAGWLKEQILWLPKEKKNQ
jgi:hypothetical protein